MALLSARRPPLTRAARCPRLRRTTSPGTVRLTAAGIPTRRHGDVRIIYKLSVALAATSSCNEHDQHDLAAGVCRCVRARVHWLARCLPTRACRAFALLRLTAAFYACLCLTPQVEFAVADSAASFVVWAAPTESASSSPPPSCPPRPPPSRPSPHSNPT